MKTSNKNLTVVEHKGHTYPAGAVWGGKLLICETKQLVWITSKTRKNSFMLKSIISKWIPNKNLHVESSIYICKITYVSNPIEWFLNQTPLLAQLGTGNTLGANHTPHLSPILSKSEPTKVNRVSKSNKQKKIKKIQIPSDIFSQVKL